MHFAFRHHGSLSGKCEYCQLTVEHHTHYVLDDDGMNDAICTVAPVTPAVVMEAVKGRLR